MGLMVVNRGGAADRLSQNLQPRQRVSLLTAPNQGIFRFEMTPVGEVKLQERVIR